MRRLARGLSRPAPWRRGLLLTALALLLGLMLLLHAQLPDAAGLGSLVESVLPWCGLGVPVLLAAALWRRSASAVVALLLPVFAWVSLFGGLLTDKSRAGHDLVVAGHNVGADNPDPAGTARTLAASGADVLALEEMTPEARPTYERELAKTYPHHYTVGTVGLWSRLPLSDPRPVDIRQDVGPLGDAKPEEEKLRYARALRATVATEQGPLTVYVAHLGSVRVMPRSGFWSESRDRNAEALAAAVAADPSERVVLLGDLNGTMDDRAFDALTAQLRSVQEESGDGFGFTWPKSFPIARIDQILVKGVEPRSAWLLPETGSDHLPVAAGIGW
nr:endonuclease/exonuclease/phosphatase family protein [Streptomyces indicus]